MKFGQLIIRKIIKIIAIGCHILKLKCTKFDFWCLCVRLFVPVFLISVSRGSLVSQGVKSLPPNPL